MSNLRKRILKGMGANAFGQLISIVTQLAALPIFLSKWDASQYGLWLMLSSIPAYFSMADVGIVNAAGNDMTMALGRGDRLTANRVFQSALIFLLLLSITVVLVVAAGLFLLPSTAFLTQSNSLTLFVMLIGILLSFFNGLSEATFRSVGLYGFGTTIGHLIRLGEWCGGMIGLFMSGNFLDVALGMLLFRAVGVLSSIFFSRMYANQFEWGFRYARLDQLKKTIQPALFFLIFPISSALSIQGFTLLVGGIFGAASVAIFNTYRTLARVTVQATGILSYSVGPELSRMFGAGEFERFSLIFRRSQHLSIAMVLLSSCVVGVLGGPILDLWTHGRIPYADSIMWSMVAYATVVGFAHVPKMLLMSINRHSKIAIASIAIYAGALLVAYVLRSISNLCIIVVVMTVGELILLLACLYYSEVEIQRCKFISQRINELDGM